MTASGQHHYRATATWSGSTGEGYDVYERLHAITTPPASTALAASADAAFRGDPRMINPEQLLLCAAVSCQLLSFLAVAARARVDVVGYRDDAQATLSEDTRPARITEIRLRPHITARGPADERHLRRLVDIAHRECFIANSLSATTTIDPTFVIEPGVAGAPAGNGWGS